MRWSVDSWCVPPTLLALLGCLGCDDDGFADELSPQPAIGFGASPPVAMAPFPATGPLPGPVVGSASCGNGRREPGENCDDGNHTDGDGCSACCDIEVVGAPSRTCALPAAAGRCGDGRLSMGERCDDGNTVSGDGCSSNCYQVEPGFTCPASGPCSAIAACGDGVVSAAEPCDYARTPNGCSRDCNPGRHFDCSTGVCTSNTTCGNGVREGYETCDDGNTASADGCSVLCAVEVGWRCPDVAAPCLQLCEAMPVAPPAAETEVGSAAPETDAAPEAEPGADAGALEPSDDSDAGTSPAEPPVAPPSSCTLLRAEPYCGDGVVDPGEDCDDGLNADPYFWELDDCGPDCRWPAFCGDGHTDTAFGEECDPGDGSTDAYGGCSSQCTLAAHCGDGIVQFEFETCDDGNRVDGDDCPWDCGAATLGRIR